MDDISSGNKRTYDSLASEYETKVAVRGAFNDFVISRFAKHITTGKSVLDIGCAVGLDMSIFSGKGFDVVGIESSEEMASFARKRNPGLDVIVGDFTKVDFDRKFDAIYAQAFIHLFPKYEAIEILAKMKDILVKDGVAHITTSKSDESKEGWFEKTDYNGHYKRFRKYWTKEELIESIERTNLKIVDYYIITDPFIKEWMVFAVKNQDV